MVSGEDVGFVGADQAAGVGLSDPLKEEIGRDMSRSTIGQGAQGSGDGDVAHPTVLGNGCLDVVAFDAVRKLTTPPGRRQADVDEVGQYVGEVMELQGCLVREDNFPPGEHEELVVVWLAARI